jgi:hypothetical protein
MKYTRPVGLGTPAHLQADCAGPIREEIEELFKIESRFLHKTPYQRADAVLEVIILYPALFTASYLS